MYISLDQVFWYFFVGICLVVGSKLTSQNAGKSFSKGAMFLVVSFWPVIVMVAIYTAFKKPID